mgnify:CR=1 FL=1
MQKDIGYRFKIYLHSVSMQRAFHNLTIKHISNNNNNNNNYKIIIIIIRHVVG